LGCLLDPNRRTRCRRGSRSTHGKGAGSHTGASFSLECTSWCANFVLLGACLCVLHVCAFSYFSMLLFNHLEFWNIKTNWLKNRKKSSNLW
jgi:hypothetical protein